MKVPPRIYSLVALMLCTLFIIVLTVKNTKPISEYMRTGIKLSSLSDKESVEYMVSKGARMPLGYRKSYYFPQTTKQLIIVYENNPYLVITGSISDIYMNIYVEDVRKIVNEYYGIYNIEYFPEIPSVY